MPTLHTHIETLGNTLTIYGISFVLVFGMTIKQALNHIRENCPQVSARYISETREYRITTKAGTAEERENAACYETDAQAAVDTARAMQVWIGGW